MKFSLCYLGTVGTLILSMLVKMPSDNVLSESKFSQKGVLCFSDVGIFTCTVVMQCVHFAEETVLLI